MAAMGYPVAIVLLCVLAVAPAHQLEVSVTPVQKVVTLLEQMKSKVEQEGAAEAVTYDQFACFCKDTTKTKSDSITSGQDNVDRFSADIQSNTAAKATKSSELADRKQNQEEFAATLSDTQARCLTEMATFEASVADLVKAVRSLTKAVTALRNSKQAPSFLLVRQGLQDGLALADALGMVKKLPEPTVEAFLQARVDPNDPGYSFHSAEIISTLDNLLTDFTARKTSTQAEWDKARQSCDDIKKDLSDQMSTNDGSMKRLEQDIDSLQTTIATSRQSLVTAESLLQDDHAYLVDLTKQCEARAQDWDQRSQMRADELKALTAALAILKDGSESRRSVQDLATVNKRALLLRLSHATPGAGVPGRRKEAPFSFLQEFSVDTAAAGQGGRRSTAATPKKVSRASETVNGGHGKVRVKDAAQFLQSEGRRLGSSALAALATRAAVEPLAEVRNIIQRLIERLLTEATQEANKKGFCDKELGKARKLRDYRMADTKKLAAEVGQLEATKDELDAEMKQIATSLATLRSSLNDTQILRDAEHTENMNTTSTAREGSAAIEEAIQLLTVFYRNAAKATSATESGKIDVDPGFEGAYKGNQEGSTGVIAMLKVIKADFQRTIRMTEENEKAAAAAFIEFERTAKTDISGKEMTLQLLQEEFETTSNALAQKMVDLASAQKLLDASIQTIEDLKPMCIDTTASYADRVAKREDEIAALKKALCYLDPNGVESECQR